MTRRFRNPKPTKFGRIGHPEAEGNKMFRCAGVIYVDNITNNRWCLRVYFPTEATPELVVWTRAVWRGDNHPRYASGFAPQEVIPAGNIDEEVKQFGWSELVRLRLTGRLSAA